MTRSGTRRFANPAVVFAIFRIGIAMCFIGHGAFGIITKSAWLPYFALVGIGPDIAYAIMPIVGTLDIVAGLIGLIRPNRAVLVYMTIWATWTALLRPLTGESAWEAVERAGNYGVPLIMLLLVGFPRNLRGWIAGLRPADLRLTTHSVMAIRVIAAALFVGHGMLALSGATRSFANNLDAIGLSHLSEAAAIVDLLFAVAVLFARKASILLAAAGWKFATEALWVAAGFPLWEVIERGGSYVAPLLIIGLLAMSARRGSAMIPRGAITAAIVVAFFPQFAGAQAKGPESLVQQLRNGGLVLACRHTHTDRSRGDRQPVDFGDRSTQRNLSARGEQDARDLGEHMRRLRIDVTEVVSSPFARNTETAQFAFGRFVIDSLLYGSTRRAGTRELIARVPERGVRILFTHGYMLNDVVTARTGGRIPEEGGCMVLRPGAQADVTLLGVMEIGDWGRVSSR